MVPVTRIITRIQRPLAALAASAILAGTLAGCSVEALERPTSTASASSIHTVVPTSPAFSDLENEFGARLGVYGIDTGTGATVTHRASERFAYASTSKALLAGAILADASESALDEIISYTEEDLVEYSPITETHLDSGMPLRDVIAAAVQYSDNTAANLLFEYLGGPGALGDRLTGIDDTTTHVDRVEPDLNEATPGDLRDTSTPQALAADLREYTFGSTLTPEREDLFADLLRGNTTGADLIRSGVPDGWVVGDKTGSAGYGTRNDIAVLWPPTGAPIVLTVLSSKSTPDAESDDELIAAAATEAIRALRPDSGPAR